MLLEQRKCCLCKEKFDVELENTCPSCVFENINKRIQNLTETQKFWVHAKHLTLMILLIVPITCFISLKFGRWFEAFFVAGFFYSYIFDFLYNKFR